MSSHGPLPSLLLPDLLPAILHHEERVGAVGHGEGEAVPERAAAIVAVADAVLVDVIHGEGGGLEGTLPAAAALDQPVPGRLHHPERDGLHLHPHTEGQSWGHDLSTRPGLSFQLMKPGQGLCPGGSPVSLFPAGANSAHS